MQHNFHGGLLKSTRWLAVLVGLLLLIGSSAQLARGANEANLTGTVMAAGKPLVGAQAVLKVGTLTGATALGEATTGSDGTFTLAYTPPSNGVLYLDAKPAASSAGASRARLRAIVGIAGDGGGVAPQTLDQVTVNEVTTVAAVFATAQFSGDGEIFGASPGLENAAATSTNLANARVGMPGGAITDANNATTNDSLATLNSLANLLAVCSAEPAGSDCAQVLTLATPPGASAPTDTVGVALNLVKNPTLATDGLFTLSQLQTLNAPALTAAPQAWLLALLFKNSGLFASGRIAIDAKGNIWSNNNWAPGTLDPSPYVVVFNPIGQPIFGTPFTGGGIQGSGWGNAIAQDGTVWIGNFNGASVSEFSAEGAPLSPDSGWKDGLTGNVQGIAVDQRGNVWIANNTGPHTPPGSGSIVVYPGGDPSKAISITGGGIDHPFAVQIDNLGRAWVSNSAPGDNVDISQGANNKASGTLTVINPNFQVTDFSPISSEAVKHVLGIALDSQGNVWANSFDSGVLAQISPQGKVVQTISLGQPSGPWGNAVDGSDRIWVAGFLNTGVYLFCGVNTAACPPGSSTGTMLSPGSKGFQSKALQHLTSLQIDPSGNVWLSNNWATLKPHSGGIGIVEFVGVAAPVCTPLLGEPTTASAANGRQCPKPQALVLPSTGAASDILFTAPLGLWVLGALMLGLGGAGLVMLSSGRLHRRGTNQQS